MDVGTAMSVAQTLFAALEYCQLKGGIRSIAGYKSQIDELRGTVSRIKAVLSDAEAKHELSEQEQLYIQDLKDAVYDADDLFDEFVTLAEQNKLKKGIEECLFSFFCKSGVAYNMARGVDKIRKRLDAIVDNSKFSLNIDPKPIRNRRPETCSYVYEADIIGREPDLEKIVGILLDSDAQQNVSFLTIVGIGGLGKTALAQLVFNDARVTSSFQLRLWTCVSDEESLDLEGVLGRILASATDQKKCGGFTMDGLQSKLRGHLERQRFLLILDDVWTENRDQWLTLTPFLMRGLRGSWIVVTTRSRETAKIVDGLVHELQGLSKENSWCMFKRAAFGPEHTNPPEDLVKIGQEIVGRCAHVPLAIKAVGSLLFGQKIHKWQAVHDMGFAKVKGNNNGIMPILKLSYYQLESPLKTCFGYCALFPKDYVIDKEILIRLWMAQGYVVPSYDQSMEDVGEEYFSILLQRCFFQDVSKGEDGDIKSCKIHDLMHDLAQEVTRKEICTVNTVIGDMDKNIRHLYFARSQLTEYSSTKKNIRSLLGWHSSSMDALVANSKYLRALDLSIANITRMPDSISELLHLRYLNLSGNECLEMLPRRLKLYNLQTLLLTFCARLKELPKDMSQLVKLSVLDLRGCYGLTYMPRGMGKLTCLHTLGYFVVGDKSQNREKWFDCLEDLKLPSNLKGYLEIRIPYLSGIPVEGLKDILRNVKADGVREGGCLMNKKHLHQVGLLFDKEGIIGREEYDEAVMELMQPHSNLKKIYIYNYYGVKMPEWSMDDNLATFLPNLVEISVYSCPKLQYLGCMGNLRHLKTLSVNGSQNLEYISRKGTTSAVGCEEGFSFFPSLEDLQLSNLRKMKGLVGDNDELLSNSNDNNSSMAPLCLLKLKKLTIYECPEMIGLFLSSSEEGFSFFPSLEHLDLTNLKKLKGLVADNSHVMAPLPILQLKYFRIRNCPEMVDIVVCPMLETLELHNFNTRLQIKWTRLMNEELIEEATTSARIPLCSSPTSFHAFPNLQRISISDVAWLLSQPMEAFQCLAMLSIGDDGLVENLGEVGEVFRSCSTSLRSLDLWSCCNLRSVTGGLEHLTALEKLCIKSCPKLRPPEGEVQEREGSGMPRQSIYRYLTSLTLNAMNGLPKVVYIV